MSRARDAARGPAPLAWLSVPVTAAVTGCAVPETDRAAPELEQRREWTALFDGASLGDFAPTGFGGEGEVRVEDGALVLEMGTPLTGVTWNGSALPVTDYEIRLTAARVDGGDFFCGLTFPVGDGHLTLILGGWGGTLCGLSCIDGLDASENEATQFVRFETGRDYAVRVAVEGDPPARVRAWLDEKPEPLIDQEVAGRELWLRPEVDLSQPLGVAAYATTARIGRIQLRRLTSAAAASAPSRSHRNGAGRR